MGHQDSFSWCHTMEGSGANESQEISRLYVPSRMRSVESWLRGRHSCKAATERGTLCWWSWQLAMTWGTGALQRQSASSATAWTTPLLQPTSQETPEGRYGAYSTSQVLLLSLPESLGLRASATPPSSAPGSLYPTPESRSTSYLTSQSALVKAFH